MVLVLNRLELPQGLHAPFVAAGALVVFALRQCGARARAFSRSISPAWWSATAQTRAHNTVVAFLDAATWLAQIAMFVLLGLLAWPRPAAAALLPALAVALALMLVARPAAVFLCLAPFRFSLREKLFISWVGLRGAVGIFLASIPLLVGLPARLSLFRRRLRGGAGVAAGAGLDHRRSPPAGCDIACRAQRSAAAPRRARSARPAGAGAGRLSGAGQQPVSAPRHHAVLGQADAGGARRARSSRRRRPIRCARATMSICWRRRRRRRRSTASSSNMPPPASPDPRLLGDFFVPGDATLGALAEIYGLQVAADHTERDAGRLFRRACSAAARQDRRHRPARPDRAAGAQGRPTAASSRSACSWPSRKPVPRTICGQVGSRRAALAPLLARLRAEAGSA